MQSQTQDLNPAITPSSRAKTGRHRFLVVVAVAAALVCGAVAGWVAKDVSTEPPQGLAPTQVTKLLDDRVAAINAIKRHGHTSVASFYEGNAVLEEHDQKPPVVTRGAQAISDHYEGYRTIGFGIAPRKTVVIETGIYVAEGMEWSTGRGIVVFRLGPSGKILHQWVFGGTP